MPATGQEVNNTKLFDKENKITAYNTHITFGELASSVRTSGA